MANSDGALAESGMAIAVISRTGECNELVVSSNHLSVCCVDGGRKMTEEDELATRAKGLGPVYTTVEKASGRSRMLGQDMVI
jgi:hypothetical protein